MATDPTIVAIGEAHAQKGSEEIASSSKRFREQLLPLLKGRASDIVIELIVAEGACKQAQEKVRETTREVTKNQAQSNKSEFVLLGERAKAMGIRPHVLRPTCDQYKALAAAGDDRIFHMLTAIADLSVELIDRILARNARSKADKAVLAYGGAMHNDVLPRKGREAFSFGPRLSELSNQRYVEIDLIVPEFIKDSDAWRALEWYGAFDGDAHPDKVTLFNPRPGSYVLIFARSAAR